MRIGLVEMMDTVKRDELVFRGQLTFELLLLMLLSFSLLFIAMSAINKISDTQKNVYEQKMIQIQLDRIADSADEVCIMGPGNSRSIKLSENVLFRPFVNLENSLTVDDSAKFSYSKKLLCDAQINGEISKIAYVWYEYDEILQEGRVIISSEPTQKG
jgi:hypothetical protein